MEETGLRFFPGSGAPPALLPLARYLPPVPPGMLTAWLAENVPPGSWLLDPLGASPALVLEAARAGYRVLVASNNPIISFLIETLAAAPTSADFQSALAELASARRGDERLETHLRQLYTTECETCGEPVEVEAFLWRKAENQPYARLYRCQHCPDASQGRGEHPIAPADIDRLEMLGGDKLQRARAIQRVILNEDDHRADVEEALESYLPRSLYTLFTLLNKAEGLGLPAERLRLLQALLLSAFDAGSTLWPHPGARARPKQLLVPPQYRENNLWRAIEDAVAEWAHQPGVVPVTRWPVLPASGNSGGICLFRGRVKSLVPLPPEIAPRALITVFPRPNQAFWTLSVLWAGWLWGSAAALPLRNVLDRRRYDWNWHTSAVHQALASVGWSLAPGTPLFGLLPELAPGFLSAVMVAGETSGFHLSGLACRVDQEIAQATWHTPATGSTPQPPANLEEDHAAPADPFGGEVPAEQAAEWEKILRVALREDLRLRNEPAAYLSEYAAGLVALARADAIPRRLSSIPGDLLTRVQASLARTFADRSFLKFYNQRGSASRGAGPSSPAPSNDEERGWWWLADPPVFSPDLLPLADRVEMEVIRHLQRNSFTSLDALDQSLCEIFREQLTPSADLVRACVESYGELLSAPGEGWRLRPGESAQQRRADLATARAELKAIGQRLGYNCLEDGLSLVWEGAIPGERWRFILMASSMISRYVLPPAPNPRARSVLVLPGSRARLLAFKLRRDPRLVEATQGWVILKLRHLRQIAAELAGVEHFSLATWEAALSEDPLTEEATQMALFQETRP